jgi:hypothetical protein
MGKSTGAWRGGSHLHWDNFYSNGVLQGQYLWQSVWHGRKNRAGAVTITSWGWGIGRGVVFESLNMASFGLLPLLFVTREQSPGSDDSRQKHLGDIAGRFTAFGVNLGGYQRCQLFMPQRLLR